MNFKELELKIEKAAKIAFKEIYEKHKEEEIYSFALYSDEGAMTVCPSTNTINFLNNLNAEDKKDIVYYKFEPAEWKYEMIGANKEFNEISKGLRTELEKNDFDNEYQKGNMFFIFQKRLYKTCFNVLKKLKKDNFFKNIIGKDILLIFAVSEYEFENSEIENMIKELNNNQYKDEYLKWMKNRVEYE